MRGTPFGMTRALSHSPHQARLANDWRGCRIRSALSFKYAGLYRCDASL